MKNAENLYNSISNGDISIQSLEIENISLIFDYMCERIEMGENVDWEILSYCEKMIDISTSTEAKDIITKTYERINPKAANTRLLRKNILRRILIAALAIITFVVSGFITASALGVDIVESVKIILTDKNDYLVIFENYDKLNYNGKPAIKRYDTANQLFQKELPNAIYPTRFPEGVEIYKVTYMHESAEDIFHVQMRTDSGNWVIIAKNSENAYLPSGYIYTAEIGDKSLDYIYTVSRKGTEITKYNVYTVYNDILYTFHFNTGNWEDIKTIIDSVVLP